MKEERLGELKTQSIELKKYPNQKSGELKTEIKKMTIKENMKRIDTTTTLFIE